VFAARAHEIDQVKCAREAELTAALTAQVFANNNNSNSSSSSSSNADNNTDESKEQQRGLAASIVKNSSSDSPSPRARGIDNIGGGSSKAIMPDSKQLARVRAVAQHEACVEHAALERERILQADAMATRLGEEHKKAAHKLQHATPREGELMNAMHMDAALIEEAKKTKDAASHLHQITLERHAEAMRQRAAAVSRRQQIMQQLDEHKQSHHRRAKSPKSSSSSSPTGASGVSPKNQALANKLQQQVIDEAAKTKFLEQLQHDETLQQQLAIAKEKHRQKLRAEQNRNRNKKTLQLRRDSQAAASMSHSKQQQQQRALAMMRRGEIKEQSSSGATAASSIDSSNANNARVMRDARQHRTDALEAKQRALQEQQQQQAAPKKPISPRSKLLQQSSSSSPAPSDE
jgi:hypothetical protein